MKGWLLALLTAVSLLGCATIDMNSKISDWPVMRITEHFLSPKELNDKCAKYGSFGIVVLACTEWSFDTLQVVTWFPLNPPLWIVEHERLHQQGYDHPNSTYMQDNWNEWKRIHGQ